MKCTLFAARVFLSLVALGAVSACQSTVRSAPMEAGATHFTPASEGRRTGFQSVERPALVYALPQRLVRMTISATPTPPLTTAQAIARLAAAQSTKSDADTLVNTRQAALSDLTAQRIADPASVTQATIDEARGLLEAAQSDQRRAARGVAEAQANLLVQQSGAGGVDRTLGVKFELLPAIPDPDEFYQATFSHSWHRDDDATLVTDNQGLLSSGQVTSTDRTSDIIVDIAGIIGVSRAGAFDAPNSANLDMPPAQCDLGRSFNREIIFDPSETADVTLVKNWLSACLNGLTLDVSRPTAFTNRPTLQAAPGQSARAQLNGIVYRRPVPYILRLMRGSDVVATAVAMLPQGGPYGIIPYEPRAFVQSVTNVSFEAGQPLSWHANNPSEVAAAFRIPVAAARALVEIPASWFSLRIDYSSRQNQLIEAQRTYICALETLAEAEGRPNPGHCDGD